MTSYLTFIGSVAGIAVLLFFAVDYYEFIIIDDDPSRALKVLRIVIVMLALLVILIRTIYFVQQL